MLTTVARNLTCFFLFLSMPVTIVAGESIAEFIQFNRENNAITANPGIIIHSIVKLTNLSVNDFKASELSGLAWDEDENILYALSDTGYLLHLRPVFAGSEITDILLLDGFHLKDKQGNRLRWKQADSEGLDIQFSNNGKHDDSILLVCFERIPRIIQFSPDGSYLKEIKLPANLQDINKYESENRSLEAITSYPDFNIIVGTEKPLNKSEANFIDLYYLSGQNEKIPSALDANGGLSGLTMFENNDLLVLERGFSGLWPTFEFALHRVSINGESVQSNVVGLFISDNGLFNDNFEGITRYKNNKFFMISDDNNHPLKRTILVYFEILE